MPQSSLPTPRGWVEPRRSVARDRGSATVELDILLVPRENASPRTFPGKRRATSELVAGGSEGPGGDSPPVWVNEEGRTCRGSSCVDDRERRGG